MPASAPLAKQAARGVAWNTLETLCVTGVGFIVSILLARILPPADFGVIAMLQVFIGVSYVLVDSGLSQALIRHTGKGGSAEGTVLLLNFGIASLLYGVLYVSAPGIAEFVNTPHLTHIIRLLMVVLPLNALTVVQTARLVGGLQFARLCIINCVAALISAAIGLTLAYMGKGVYALVWQQVALWGSRAVLLWCFAPLPGRIAFSRSECRSLYGFGWKLMLSSLIESVWNNIYPLIIGHFFTPRLTGFYSRAATFASYGPTTLMTVLSRVIYPVMCRMQGEQVRTGAATRLTLSCAAILVFPVMGMLIATAEPLFGLVLTDKWLPAVPYFRVLCAASALYPLHALNLEPVKAAGRSDIFLKAELLKKGVGVVALCITIPMGVEAMCVGVLITSLLCFGINVKAGEAFTGLGLVVQLRLILPVGVVAALSAAAAWSVMQWLDTRVTQLVAGIAMATMTYITLALVLNWKKKLNEYRF